MSDGGHGSSALEVEQRYCAKCGHPEKDHGGPAGCDWEVSDWGTLDCGCMDFVPRKPETARV